MRLGRWNTVALGAALGGLLLTVAGPVAAVGPTAVAPAVVPETGAFIIRSPQGKGLVTLTQSGSTATLRFQLLGLKPSHQYRLVGSTKGCASSKGVLFNRTFTSTTKGTFWDPTTYQIDARTVDSVRLINKASGAVLGCAGSAEIPFTVDVVAAKLKTGAIRGLVVETEPEVGSWYVIATFSGLTANGDYAMNGRTGSCEGPDNNVWSRTVDASAGGTAFERYYPNAQSSAATIVELRPASDVTLDDPALACATLR